MGITTTGWTQCSINTVTSSTDYNSVTATPPPPEWGPSAKYTPSPGTTPAAVIEAGGTTAPGGTNTPAPTQTTVPTYNGATNAAVFGALLNDNYNTANFGYNGLCQQVTIPANGATLTAHVFAQGNQTSKYAEDLVAAVDTQTEQSMLGLLYMENVVTATNPGDTAYRQISVDLTPFAGQTINLYIGMWTDSGQSASKPYYSSYWFVDDVILLPKTAGSTSIKRKR